MRNKKGFWSNVDKTGDHWLWTGAIFGNGHGAYRTRPAHQVAYELQYNVKLSKDDVIHHRDICLIKLCVFGPHLERTTKLEHPDSLSTINRNKTHCKNGHEFTPQNTYKYISTNGWGRACKRCHALSGKKRRLRFKMNTFQKELESLINRYSKENESNTPDFILAEYMNECLNAYTKASRAREKWYGKELHI